MDKLDPTKCKWVLWKTGSESIALVECSICRLQQPLSNLRWLIPHV